MLRHVLSICCLSLLLTAAANADEVTPALTDPAPAKGWIITLGGSLQLGPKYDGANSAGPSFMPSISWRRVGEPAGFSAPDDGFSLALYEADRFSLGAVGSYRPGRYSSSSPRLIGMHDVPWSIEAGAFAEYWLISDRFRTRVEVRQGFYGHHGIVADFFADWVERLGGFTFAVGPRLTLGSTSFMRRNFGVRPEEAAVNGMIMPYRPGGGAKSVGLASSLEYAWSPTFSSTFFARYDRLVDDAARSPLVEPLGQRDQFSFGVGVNYSFQVGELHN